MTDYPLLKPQVVQAAKPKCPSRYDLINAIADAYDVDYFIALEWLEAEFRHIKDAA